ncbi:MAG: response regulator [Thermosynechococcaceae cyanobacterium]
MISFQAGQLWHLLEKCRSESFTGVAQVDVVIDATQCQRSLMLALRAGHLTFVGKTLPSPTEFALLIQQKLNIAHMESALKVSALRVKNQNSIRELFEFISRFGLFKWEDLERVMHHHAVVGLEQVLPYGGTCRADTANAFDLSYGNGKQGFDWVQLDQDLTQRQQVWTTLAPSITGPDTIPLPSNADLNQISDLEHRQLAQWVDGQRSLLDIAAEANLDPLEVAKIYWAWSKKGWIGFKSLNHSGLSETKTAQSPTAPTSQSDLDLPIVLSVDDSPIVQTMIKRAIGDRYQVIAANNAVDALNLLNTRNVALMLLDVTMPDIDGLELCRTIRNIAKFKDLPVVMLTAKDGLLDKVRGQFAGSTHYLIKPIDREKLLPILDRYIAVKAATA